MRSKQNQRITEAGHDGNRIRPQWHSGESGFPTIRVKNRGALSNSVARPVRRLVTDPLWVGSEKRPLECQREGS